MKYKRWYAALLIILGVLVAFLLLLRLSSPQVKTQNTLPPAKQAIEDRYAAGQLHAAPKRANAPVDVPPQVTISTGIQSPGTCDQPPTISSKEFRASNCWVDVRNCGQDGCEITRVAAGNCGSDDPDIGCLVVQSNGTASTLIVPPAPRGAVGPLRIIRATGRVITLLSANGYILAYNVDADQFSVVTTPSSSTSSTTTSSH